jgi:hypothetical protein
MMSALLGALACGAIITWIESGRRRAQHLRPDFTLGTLHRRPEPPNQKRIDQG